jgi:hypothetical protein
VASLTFTWSVTEVTTARADARNTIRSSRVIACAVTRTARHFPCLSGMANAVLLVARLPLLISTAAPQSRRELGPEQQALPCSVFYCNEKNETQVRSESQTTGASWPRKPHFSWSRKPHFSWPRKLLSCN